jgi:hypothetical protein
VEVALVVTTERNLLHLSWKNVTQATLTATLLPMLAELTANFLAVEMELSTMEKSVTSVPPTVLTAAAEHASSLGVVTEFSTKLSENNVIQAATSTLMAAPETAHCCVEMDALNLGKSVTMDLPTLTFLPLIHVLAAQLAFSKAVETVLWILLLMNNVTEQSTAEPTAH